MSVATALGEAFLILGAQGTDESRANLRNLSQALLVLVPFREFLKEQMNWNDETYSDFIDSVATLRLALDNPGSFALVPFMCQDIAADLGVAPQEEAVTAEMLVH